MSLKQTGIRLSAPFTNFRLVEDGTNASTSGNQDGGVDNVDDSQGGYGGQQQPPQR